MSLEKMPDMSEVLESAREANVPVMLWPMRNGQPHPAEALIIRNPDLAGGIITISTADHEN